MYHNKYEYQKRRGRETAQWHKFVLLLICE
jgi:hypothetical protein